MSDRSNARRIASPAALLTPSALPLPRKPAHARAAASVACTSSKESSPRASKEGIPLLSCSIALGLGLFQQIGGPKLHLVAALQERGLDEVTEQWVRSVRPRAELGVELACDEPRVILELDDLHESTSGTQPAEDHPGLVHHLAVLVVELEAMAVPLVHD